MSGFGPRRCSGAGAVPTIAPGSADALTGLFYGGGAKVLIAQCIGSATICISTFVVAMIMFSVLNALGLLRISEAGELEGMDIHEHGISAYPEYVISASAAPGGLPDEMVHAGFGKSPRSAPAVGGV
jgi:Amt family ammonium transporter